MIYDYRDGSQNVNYIRKENKDMDSEEAGGLKVLVKEKKCEGRVTGVSESEGREMKASTWDA